MSESLPTRAFVIEWMLALGLVGLLEMAVAYAFWGQIAQDDRLGVFRPGEPVSAVAALLVVLGGVAAVAVAGGLFWAWRRRLRSRNVLAAAYVLGLAVVGVLYAGV